MSFLKLATTGWVYLAPDPRDRTAEAVGAEVLIRRAHDPADEGPRAILKPGIPVTLPGRMAYSARLLGSGRRAGLRTFTALPLKSALIEPGFDIFPITPDDTIDLPTPTSALYVSGNAISFVTLAGHTRTVPITLLHHIQLPIRVSRVLATGTDADVIFGIV